jgi:peptidoglycan/xylan/chitin deacetylase (PgdA/CDA1 family)
VGESAATDPYHFGNYLVKQIKETPGQELATHTFSHYYCLENGQTISEFEADIKAAVEVAAKNGSVIKSIVFPRNQYNADYLDICMKYGITSIRGNEHSWLYEPRAYDQETGLRRAFRLLDAYINFTGHHGYAYRQIASSKPFNIASSRFLRQYKPSMDLLEWLRLRRIKKSMTHAAKNNLVFHLWWHPHNFGINQEKNMEMLTRILDHYRLLNRQYGFKNLSMAELSQQLDSIHES